MDCRPPIPLVLPVPPDQPDPCTQLHFPLSTPTAQSAQKDLLPSGQNTKASLEHADFVVELVVVVVPPGKDTIWTRVGVFSGAGYGSTGNVRMFVPPRRTSTPGLEKDV